MARKVNSRVLLNRAALTELGVAVAEGVEEVAMTIVETAEPPDAPAYGQGLVQEGGWLVYSGTRKVGGGSLTGEQPPKPRGFKLIPDVITGMAGFGFPARFQEVGTAHQPARPFLWPAALEVARVASSIMASIVGPRLRR